MTDGAIRIADKEHAVTDSVSSTPIDPRPDPATDLPTDPTTGAWPTRLERDQLAIRRLVEDWVMHRDSGDWAAFRQLWAADGWMSATWFQGPADRFIEASRHGFDHGVRIAHTLGGHTCVVVADRAVAQTKMTINQRAVLHDVLVDVSCSGRFYDFLHHTHGRWRVRRRQPVYERDRLDPVDPTSVLTLDGDDRSVLASYPEGYRWLALVQRRLGDDVKHGMPGLTGPELDHLQREGAAWLDGVRSPFVQPELPGPHST